MTEVTNLDEVRQQTTDEFWAKRTAMYEIMREPIPIHTKLARWILRRPKYGEDFEQRVQERFREITTNPFVHNEDAQIIEFRRR